MQCALILNTIRSVHNVGSIFRTADAAGVSKIFLVGYTPTPLDRFGRARADFAKVSLGAEKTIPWEHAAGPATLVKKLRADGFMILAVEQSIHAKNLFSFNISKPTKKIALILGNEVTGLSRSNLKLADHILEIPMRGNKESLNVSVAAGIALYSLLFRNEP